MLNSINCTELFRRVEQYKLYESCRRFSILVIYYTKLFERVDSIKSEQDFNRINLALSIKKFNIFVQKSKNIFSYLQSLRTQGVPRFNK